MTSTATDPTSAALRAEIGDAVTVATPTHDWATALEVADATPPVRWRVPFGEDWVTRTVVVETSTGTPYEITVDTHATDYAARHTDDGDGYRLGPVDTFSPADTDVDYHSDEDDQDQTDEELDLPDWLGDHPAAIVEASPAKESLAYILDEVEKNDTILGVHRRLGGVEMSATRKLLWSLGLRKRSDAPLDDDVLEERLETLREFVDDQDGGDEQ